MVGAVCQADTGEFTYGFFVRLLPGHFLYFCQTDHHIVERGKMVEKQKVLEDHTHVLADFVFIHAMRGDLATFEEDLPAVDVGQQIHATQERAFARSARTDDDDGFAFMHIERNIFEDDILTVNFSHVPGLQNDWSIHKCSAYTGLVGSLSFSER